jgi:MoxR-like ATPase
MDVEQQAAEFREVFDKLKDEIGRVIVGSTGTVEAVLTCIFAGGHCLLEGVPGLGKTMLVRTISEALHLNFSRIQFTPDLMPADIIGTNMLVEDAHGRRQMEFRAGPLFANIILADEINRATPKTQSALLEAMQEHTVSVARTIHKLQEPFFVLATQNPIEMDGTYPLPEAQLDRFLLKVTVDYPSREELTKILDRTTNRDIASGSVVMDGTEILKWQGFVRDVVAAPQVTDYAVRLVLATQPGSPFATDLVNKYARYGSSPRGAQALLLAAKVQALRAGRFNVSFKDIQQVALHALRHRVLVNFEADAEGITSDQIVRGIIDGVKTAELVA